MCEYEQNNYLPPLCEALTKGGTCTFLLFFTKMYFIKIKMYYYLLVQVQSINNNLMGTNCTCMSKRKNV